MRTSPTTSLFACAVAGLAIFAAGCGKSDTAAPTSGGAGTTSTLPELKVGVIPFEQVDKIKSGYQPFVEYLGKKTGGRPARLYVTPDYSGTLQALRSGQIDCAYLNPLSYVLAVQEFRDSPEHLIPLGMPWFHGKPTYKGIVYVRADSGITAVKDFRGKSFAFGDRTSTSGYLYPAGLMKEAGIDPNKDIKAANITGPGGVLAVLNKQVAGGATFEGGLELALKDPAELKQMKVIATTDPIPNGMFVARGDLDPAEVTQLKQALQTINTEPDGQAALKTMQYDKWVPADDHAFDSVRKKATVLGLKLESLDAPKK